MSVVELNDPATLYEVVTCFMNCIVSGDAQYLADIEKKISQIEVIEDYIPVLCKFIESRSEPLEERLAAAIYMKNYLERVIDKETESILFNKERAKLIFERLLICLEANDSRLKEIIAINLGLILGLGFWNECTTMLMNMIATNEPDQINIAMYVLNRAINVQLLCDRANVVVEPEWFNVLLNILRNDNLSSNTRTLTAEPLMLLMRHLKPNEDYLPNCLKNYAEAITAVLNEPFSATSEFKLKCALLGRLNKNLIHFRGHLDLFVPILMPHIGKILCEYAEMYKKVLKGIWKPPFDSEEMDASNFYEFIVHLLDFSWYLFETYITYFETMVDDLKSFLYCLFTFMACAKEMDIYLFDDIVISDYQWKMRETCIKIIVDTEKKMASSQSGKIAYFRALQDAFSHLTREMRPELNNDDQTMTYFHRVTEAMITTMCSLKDKLENENETHFFVRYLIKTWTNLLGNCPYPLHGRILLMGSLFCCVIDVGEMEIHLKKIMENIQNRNAYLTFPSIEALRNYFRGFERIPGNVRFLITHKIDQFYRGLMTLFKKPDTYPIDKTLNTLGYLVKSHSNISKEKISQLEDILFKCLSHHTNNPDVMDQAYFLCAKIAQAQGFKHFSHDQFSNFLIQFLNDQTKDAFQLDLAFEMFLSIITYSQVIDDELVLELLDTSVNHIHRNVSRDAALDQSAGYVLLALIAMRPEQVKNLLQSARGGPIIRALPDMFLSLLQPNINLLNNVLGKLVITTILVLPQLMGPHFKDILKHVVTSCVRLNDEKVRTAWQIFIFILTINCEHTLNFLSALPGPRGGSAFKFMLERWRPAFFSTVDPIEQEIIAASLIRILQKVKEEESIRAKLNEVVVDLSEWRTNPQQLKGTEYLYYMLIQCLLHVGKRRQHETPGTAHLGDYHRPKRQEDEEMIFFNHQFHINVVEHVVTFLNTPSEICDTVVKYMLSNSDCIALREMGCSLPERDLPEAME